MITKTQVRKDAYFDSVTLMRASSKMCEIPGVRNAAIMMGTDHNRTLMTSANLIHENTPPFTPNDTVIGIVAESGDAIEQALRVLEDFFAQRASADAGKATAKTFDGAKRIQPGLSFAVISVPGRYASAEADKALDMGLHVLLFSDNVTLEEEIALKDKAVEKGLLMMGPDCGTAIINGSALGFANAVRRGSIGLVSAAGTGLQEVTVLIDRFGGGVSQALGTGGRDLREAVNGRMMHLCLDALRDDPSTEVIVVISKPPHPAVMTAITEKIKAVRKPVVACFLGGGPAALEGTGAKYAKNLEDAARLAVELANGRLQCNDRIAERELDEIAEGETTQLARGQSCLRGLYSGGALCYEALLTLQEHALYVFSNISADEELLLPDIEKSRGHTLLDMGDDYFTNSLPHPMIAPRLRVERIAREARDPATAVLLVDCVAGYGSHENPAGALAPAIRAAKKYARSCGRYLSVIASVCGTESDPQKRSEQEEILRSAGVIVTPCNAQAARLAAKIILHAAGRPGRSPEGRYWSWLIK